MFKNSTHLTAYMSIAPVQTSLWRASMTSNASHARSFKMATIPPMSSEARNNSITTFMRTRQAKQGTEARAGVGADKV